jgi:hypothetical protein
MLVAFGITDEEHDRLYQEKMELNRQRQRDGYDGMNKCPKCKRALDDPEVKCTTQWCMHNLPA